MQYQQQEDDLTGAGRAGRQKPPPRYGRYQYTALRASKRSGSGTRSRQYHRRKQISLVSFFPLSTLQTELRSSLVVYSPSCGYGLDTPALRLSLHLFAHIVFAGSFLYPILSCRIFLAFGTLVQTQYGIGISICCVISFLCHLA